jgi:hypothetical protein
MSWTLRTGRLSDVEAVLQLWEASDAEPTHTDNVTSLGQLIVHDRDALIIAEDDGRLVGSVIAGWDGWRGSVYRLVVAPPPPKWRGMLLAHPGRIQTCLARSEFRVAPFVVTDELLTWTFG